MEEMNTMIANEVAADVAPVDAADINTEISDTIEASTSQFGLKEGLVLGGLVLGTGAIIYTGIDIFKRLKKHHDLKKAAAELDKFNAETAQRQEEALAAAQQEDDTAEDTEE